MLKHSEFQLNTFRMPLRKLAEREGAGAARLGRARDSNPYPTTGDTVPRREWFRGYDEFLAEVS